MEVCGAVKRQKQRLAPELAVVAGTIGLSVAAMILFGAGRSERCRFQRAVGHLGRQWPAEPSPRQPFQRTVDGATRTRRAISLSPTPAVLKRSISGKGRIGILSAGIRSPVQKAKGADPVTERDHPGTAGKSSWNIGRDRIGMLSDIIAASRATSLESRIGC